ncbi:MAG: CRISPR-associated helicase/endonuclease Cas3, partial [Armatimonadota bacterium]
AAATGKERVLFAVPYTSIIEQTACDYRKIFESLSPDAVLEHHASLEVKDDEDLREVRRKLAAENWDHPLIVTTNAQLFDSLFSNRPSKVRKLHRLANAVLVLDEIQSLPADLLQPCLDALGWLVRHANTTVVLCTATQPDYANVPEIPAELREAREIAPSPPALFGALRRVVFEDLDILNPQEVAERLRAERIVLAILDTKKDALAVLEALEDPRALHLSTLLCGAHRRKVLEKVKVRLKKNLPLRLIATQVVEAGVDVDFPVVLRSRGPLSSIIQAAGRCNREGRLPEHGRCGIFTLKDGGMPPGEYRTAAGIAALVVKSHLEELEMPHVQADYFRQLLSPTSVGTDRRNPDSGETVQSLREQLDFPQVDRLARLIRDETTPVVIESCLPDSLKSELNGADVPTRGLFRHLGPYTVALRDKELKRFASDSLVRDHPNPQDTWIKIWTGGYDRRVGLGRGNFAPVQELMA